MDVVGESWSFEKDLRLMGREFQIPEMRGLITEGTIRELTLRCEGWNGET